MDIALLVKILTPCLPFLMNLGEKASEKAAEVVGEKTVEDILPTTRKIWKKLFPKVEAKVGAEETAVDLAKEPKNEDCIASFRQQLRKILEDPANTDLAAEIFQIIEEEIKPQSNSTQINQTTNGNDNQIIGINNGKAIKNVTGNVTM